MLRTILKITFIIAVIALILYLLPQDTKRAAKEKALALISKILPASAKEKITNLSLSPEEKRVKFIAELEKNLTEIKQGIEKSELNPNKTTNSNANLKNTTSNNASSTKNIIQNLEQAQTLLNEIKENNTNQGIIQKTVTSLTTTIKNLVTNTTSTQTTTSPSCVCE